MSDPLEQLDRFRSEVEGAPMLSAADARRRGDLLRRRGTALKAGVALLAVAAVVVPLSLGGGHGRQDDHIADPTTGSTVTAANVLADDETAGDAGGHWVREYDSPNDGQDVFNPCARGSVASLGATSVYRRNWHSAGSSRPAGSLDVLNEIVGQFPSHHAAWTASNSVGDWVRKCSARIADQSGSNYVVASDNGRVVGPEKTVTFIQSSYSPQPGPTGRFLETAVVVVGDRLAVMTWQYDGQDFTSAPTLVQRMISGIETRLADTVPTTGPEAPPGSGEVGSGPADGVPAGLPMAEGWTTLQPESGSFGLRGPSRTLAAPEFSACGQTYADPDHTDRVIVSFNNPEDGNLRMLTTYADTAAAVSATKSLVDLYSACDQEPGQPTGYIWHFTVQRTEASGDSWMIGRYNTYNGAPGIGLTLMHVVRVGRAVLVLERSNEGGETSIPGQLKGMTTEAQPTIDAMCTFTEAGC